MTDESPHEPLLDELENGAEALRVVRDVTFSRSVADRGIVLDLGRDMEIGFLQVGPNLIQLADHGETEGLSLDPVLTETSRIRLPWPSALDLAMNVIREGIGKGAVNVPLVLDAIKSYPSAADDESSDEAK